MFGGKGWGWAAAWFNLAGLLFVVSSVNFGVFLLFRDLFLVEVLHMDVSAWVSAQMFDTGWWIQTIFISAITATQALCNHYGIKATTIVTDFNGYIIFAGAIVLTVALLYWAPAPIDIGRLFTFTNFTGEAGGSVWPTATQTVFFALVLGLLQGVYTITGFDASGHTSEEKRNAAESAPRGMIHSVFWSVVFGYFMVCSFVLAMPTVEEGAAQGWLAFPYMTQKSLMPIWLKDLLIILIVVSNYLCALSGLTSCSRMMFAFSRDGGLPGSKSLRYVNPSYRTPTHAIWWGAILSILATLYGGAFVVLSTGCAVFLYLSYIMVCGYGLWAEINGTWTKKGPFSLGAWSKVIAALAVIGCAILIYVGVQPPNEKVGYLIVIMIVAMAIIWLAFERTRFQGPPLTEEAVKRRQAIIAAEERAVGAAE